jgi:hypothetical protein
MTKALAFLLLLSLGTCCTTLPPGMGCGSQTYLASVSEAVHIAAIRAQVPNWVVTILSF